MNSRTRRLVPAITLSVAVVALLSGCLDRKLKPLNPCLVSGVVAEIAVTNIDKVDLLFMVDNSGSMSQEQEALAAEFPKLIKVLTTGDRNNDGDNMDDTDFAPAKDLHLGVVSSDLGLVGISDIMHCAGLGDDGVMQNEPRLANCGGPYPRFLSYRAGVNDPDQTANDFSCIATLGTEGCGFEQQLETTLKALWPQVDPMPKPDGTNRITFLGDTNGFGQFGHGDNDNMGFLRNDPIMGLSLIAIIVVSDEEDCSSLNTLHFRPNNYLDPAKPEDAQLLMQGLNVRCNFNPQNLYPVDRYVKGFKALRPNAENLVIFAAIVGVPEETVNAQALEQIADSENAAARDAFYQHIFEHRLMQPVVDDHGTADVNDDTMQASCNTSTGTAYPPIRIVQVAQGFGANGVVQSICQEDFGPAMDAIIAVIAKQLGSVCLPRPLVRNSSGTVGCNVVWELPAADKAPSGTPTQCQAPDFEFLLPPEEGEETMNKRGGARCRVAQLAVTGSGDDKTTMPFTDPVVGQPFNDGWYYDDYSNDTRKECTTDPKQRIAFTTRAKPPTGVTVKLECLNETQSLAENRKNIATGIEQPSIGSPCKEVMRNGMNLMGDAACVVTLNNGETDDRMFCHDNLNVCVLSCETDTDCPAAWVCDPRPSSSEASGGQKFCVNPTCGDLK